MKKASIIIAIIAAALAVIILGRSYNSRTDISRRPGPTQTRTQTEPARVPAHYEEAAASLNDLPPTLPPERFFGQARQAYQVAREIPQTLAQLPCYCYCDESFGHKSLHSCYESDHSSQCAVCVSEALMAYQLQKQGMTPKQIRERIINEFSPRQ